MLSVLKQDNSSDVAVMWMLGILKAWQLIHYEESSDFFLQKKDAYVKGIEMSDFPHKRKLGGRADTNWGL